MTSLNDPRQNGLIAAMTNDEWLRLEPDLELVEGVVCNRHHQFERHLCAGYS